MKRLLIIILILLSFISCQKDDDLSVFCNTVFDLKASDITNSSITLNWINTNAEKTVDIEYGIAGFTQGTGMSISTTDTAITIHSLNANTAYEFYIQSICSVDNISIISDSEIFTTSINPVVSQFLPKLSQLHIFSGKLSDLNPSANAFKYELSNSLYTDYAHKQHLIALPKGEAMIYYDDGLPIFPDGTVLVKTLYYNLNETDLSVGKKIIETGLLIKESGIWHLGNYVWNEDQTDAFLDEESHALPVNWIDAQGNEKNIVYKISNYPSCIMCHQNNGKRTPLGPKLRNMNFDVDGINQLQQFIDDGYLVGAPATSSIGVLPKWEDSSFSAEIRTRVYFDVNCSHCHSPGGYHNMNHSGHGMDLRFETSFDDSKIYEHRYAMQTRLPTSIQGYSMPFIGVTVPHAEALALIIPFLESLN
jgi:Fibronectin type III domain